MSRTIPRLHLISDRSLCPLERFPEVAARAVAGGVDAVHLRERDLPGGVLAEAARRVRERIGGAALFVNERVDVALAVGARGVQLGEQSLRPSEARAIAGDRLLIGRSVHDVDGALAAARDGADFVLAGHVYPTRSKPGLAPRGVAFVAEVVRACPMPVVAIGGVTPERVAEVLAAGAWGVAVISGILAADDPAAAAAAYRRAMEEFERYGS